MKILLFYILFFGFYFLAIFILFLLLRKLSYFKLSIISLFIGLILGFFFLYKRKAIYLTFRGELNTINLIRKKSSSNCSSTIYTLQLKKKDSYKLLHRPKAIEVTHNGYIKNQSILRQFLKSKRLVEIDENDGYFILNLKHSSKHLTPFAYKRLIELGQLFRSKITNKEEKKSYFIISSVTRDQSQQNEVKKSNPRTATKDLSTHSFGVAFDIMMLKAEHNCENGLNALTIALAQMQKEKKILLCTESSCIHVTVIK